LTSCGKSTWANFSAPIHPSTISSHTLGQVYWGNELRWTANQRRKKLGRQLVVTFWKVTAKVKRGARPLVIRAISCQSKTVTQRVPGHCQIIAGSLKGLQNDPESLQ
jgi:hypothetical protein